MCAFKQQALIALLRHERRRGTDALVRPAVEGERPNVMGDGGKEHENLPTGRQCNTLNGDRPRRFELAQRGCDLAQRRVGDLLPCDAAAWRHAEQYVPSLGIEEAAQCLRRWLELSRRLFELEGLGFSSGNKAPHFPKVHGLYLTSLGGPRKPMRSEHRRNVRAFTLFALSSTPLSGKARARYNRIPGVGRAVAPSRGRQRSAIRDAHAVPLWTTGNRSPGDST